MLYNVIIFLLGSRICNSSKRKKKKSQMKRFFTSSLQHHLYAGAVQAHSTTPAASGFNSQSLRETSSAWTSHSYSQKEETT